MALFLGPNRPWPKKFLTVCSACWLKNMAPGVVAELPGSCCPNMAPGVVAELPGSCCPNGELSLHVLDLFHWSRRISVTNPYLF